MDALRLGLTPRELSGPLFRRAFRNVHVWAFLDAEHPMQRIREVAALLPDDSAVTGWASAYVHGAVELDGGVDPVLPVPVALAPHRKLSRPCIQPIRAPLDAEDLTEVRGLPVVGRVRGAFDHARLSTLVEAVVGLDAMLRHRLITLDDLRAYCKARAGWKGIPVVRRALELADSRAASPQESRLRMFWMLKAGLARPLVNCAIYHEDGYLLGIADLLDVEAGLVAEYDGSEHRGLKRHTNDNAREEDLERAGLTVVRATSLDLHRRQAALAFRLRDGRGRGMRRNRSRDRWWIKPDA